MEQDDPSNLIDENGKKLLQEQLVDMMIHCSENNLTKLSNILSEMISIMGRKYLQNDWP